MRGRRGARGACRFGFALALLLAGCADAKDIPAPAVVAAESTASRLERHDDVGIPDWPPAYQQPMPEFRTALAALPAVARALDAHLATSPRDARGLVARGRLLRHQYQGAEYNETGVEKLQPKSDPRPEILALLDRALAVDSTRSDAEYEKALTLTSWFGIGSAAGQGTERFEDALPFARRAHRAAPRDGRRIDLLERCLLATGQDLEAEKVRDPSAGADGKPTQVGRILERSAMVPSPPGMLSMPGQREALAMLVQPQKQDRTAAARYARTRIYQTVSTPADSILAFYRSVWPGLAWNDQRTKPEPQMFRLATRFAVATLRWEKGKGWVPAGAEVADPFQRQDVLVLMLEEMNLEEALGALPEEARQALPDSLRNQPLPTTSRLTILDRVEESP